MATPPEVLQEVFYDGTWHDVHGEVHGPPGTAMQRGLTTFGKIRPARIGWTFLNPTEKWTPDNPMSPLYGIVGRALPCRVSVDSAVRVHAEAAQFVPERALGETPKVALQADGILARILSWETPLQSPMYRANSRRTTLLGHWPCEEGRNATQLSNTLAGGLPGQAVGVTFGNEDCPNGASAALQLDENSDASRIGGKFVRGSTTDGWQICWSIKLPALPSGGLRQMISWRTTNGYSWAINLDTGLFNVKVVDQAGTVLEDSNVGFTGFSPPDDHVTIRVKASASGGTVTAEFAWYVQEQDTPWGFSPTFSGTVGALDTWNMNGNAYMQDALICHVFGVEGGTDDLLGFAAVRAFDGYVRELAGDRFGRLLDEEGIGWSIAGDADDTMPMGRQSPDSLPDQLQEIADTERGLIYDAQTVNEVELRTRTDMYRQTPVTFTWPDDIAPPFQDRYDYVGVANRVTVSQRDGGEATASLDSGPMSVQPAPDGIGEKKADLDVNVSDETILPVIAGWELAQGTLPGARFPQVVFNMSALPADVRAKVVSVALGDRITIDGFLYDLLDLMVIGIDEKAPHRKAREVAFTCIPGQVFGEVGEYDHDDDRYDLGTCTLAAAAVAGATSLSLTMTDDESWSTSEAFDLVIAGERIGVPAGGMAARAGTGPYTQALTGAVRGKNGVWKLLPAGSSVQLYSPRRYGI